MKTVAISPSKFSGSVTADTITPITAPIKPGIK